MGGMEEEEEEEEESLAYGVVDTPVIRSLWKWFSRWK